jgi:hypothetical protein
MSAPPDPYDDEPKSEVPTKKFRGTWNPPELFYLLEEGDITTTDFVLLSIIDSLVDARGEGCWASNGYLAKRLRVRSDHIQASIRKLCEIGLLRRVGTKKFQGRLHRVLETRWSRVNIRTDGINPMGPPGYIPPRDDSSDEES